MNLSADDPAAEILLAILDLYARTGMTNEETKAAIEAIRADIDWFLDQAFHEGVTAAADALRDLADRTQPQGKK